MNNRNFSFNRRRPFPTLIILGLTVILVIWLAGRVFRNQATRIISPLAETIEKKFQNKPVSATSSPQLKNPSQLIVQIRNLLVKENGSYSVYLYDLTSNQGYGINETGIFTAASVNKIPILAAIYFEAERGALDLDERITLQQNDIQDYGTGSLRYDGIGKVYSLKTLAQLMIEKSDNTAAFVLSKIVGLKRIQELVENWGLTQTDMLENKTSNKDIAMLMTKMYKNQIANQARTLEMVGFMDDSDFENRLPAQLPEEVVVYHKIGTEVGNIHDVGIFALANHPYYLGVMSNDISDETRAETVIAEISKLTYAFMSQ
ncbi:TPA: hypothetical protein DIV55_01340 [Patescibacteria group bacterium]|uniref:Peptidoglycan-binding domain 1 protein n=1 Tax=Candidatus Gottesmanbacteria bacterium GW2011_GWA1_43_11 TaxID=1618436 RepID=A0A0G1FBL5_9BACT|nr:MAG: Peptidoglycan-binding domain 1 protein [Candidatus Gottesmanbacteria bacterium GW2011_GWA1_43_11]HCS78367.1 hypothetical protein [Patescibacteria group bacterium]